MTLVAGVDSSTQSCKVVIRDAETGALVRTGSAVHPPGTEVDPDAWWAALRNAISAVGGLDDVGALAVGGQQHGMVVLDERGEVIRPALLWNDTRSAGAAVDLVAELGTIRGSGADDGPRVWAEATGSVPVASLTVTKLRWLAEQEPENAARVAAVALPHDWLTWKLRGTGDIADLTTDRSDASGTGYFGTANGEYDRALLDLALRRDASRVVLPRVLRADERAGTTPGGIVLGPGCGDNAGAALGLGMASGDISISIGTSGVVAAVTDEPVSDPEGTITGFADATGRFLPLAVTLNGSQVLDAVRTVLEVDHGEFDRMALAAPAGAGGLTLVPYFQGERTPNLPTATGSVLGVTLENLTRENLARAAVEGLLSGLADGLEAFVARGVPVERVRLTGGAARSRAVQQIAPAVLGREVLVPAPGEYVAGGAARQAAWVLTGELPTWEITSTATVAATATPEVRERYAERRRLWVER
ncbi:MAG TPA: xylulokinase [Actinomycetaceae bacterium]|nr:xylulokinase [Actinomycetaceae bacterium]